MYFYGRFQKRNTSAAFGLLLISPSKYLCCLAEPALGLGAISPVFHSFRLAAQQIALVFLLSMSLICHPCPLEIGSLSESPSLGRFMIPFNSHSVQ